MSGVEIKVRANTRQARSDLSKLNKSVGNLEAQAAKVQKTFRNLAVTLGSAFAASTFTKTFTRAGDSVTNLNNRLALVVGKGDAAAKALNNLYAVAADTRSSVEQSAETYQRFGLALKDSGKNAQDFLEITKLVNQAAILSSTGPESAKAAIIQLGQGLASGQLRGQELNSVLEQTPRLAKAIADGMSIPFGNLRKAAEDGLLTTEAVYDAIISQGEALGDEFLLMKATVGDLTTVFNNEWTRAIAEIDAVVGFSESAKNSLIILTEAARYVAKNFRKHMLEIQLAISVAKSVIRRFVKPIRDTLVSMFNPDFDAEGFSQQVIDAVKALPSKVKETVIDPITIKIKDINLDGGIDVTKLSAAQQKFQNFVSSVKKIFYSLWKTLIGGSTYTGIIDPAHEHEGKAAIGNTKKMKIHLDAATNAFKSFTDGLKGIFESAHSSITKTYNRMALFLENRQLTPSTISFESLEKATIDGTASISKIWNDTFTSISEAFDSFIEGLSTKEISGGPAGQVVTVETEFGAALTRMEKRYEEFKAKLYETELVPVGPVGQQTEEVAVGPLARLQEKAGNIKISFQDNSEKIISDLSLIIDQLKLSPIFTSGKIVVENLFDVVTGKNEFLQDLFSDIDASKEGIGVAIGASIALGVRYGFKRSFFIGAFLLSFDDIVNSENFQKSARELGQGAGQLLKLAFSDETSGLGLSALDGLKITMGEFGAGVLEMMFPNNDFQNGFKEKLTGFIVVGATAAALSSRVRVALRTVSGLIISGIFGASFATAAKAAATKALKGLGVIGVVTLAVDIIPIAPSLEKLGLSEEAAQFGEDLAKNITTGGTAGAIVGTSFIPVLGTAIGAAIGAAFGLVYTLASYREFFVKWQESIETAFGNAWEWFKGLVSDLVTPVTDSMTKGFENAWNWLVKKLETIKSYIPFMGDDEEDFASIYDPPRQGVYMGGGQAMARGGYVSGPGTGTSDSIPALLSNGEYVIKADAVKKLGLDRLNLLNSGILPRFFRGGLAGGSGGYQYARDEMVRAKQAGNISSVLEMAALLRELGKLEEALASLDETMQESLKDDGVVVTEDETSEAFKSLGNQFVGDIKAAMSEALKTGDVKGFFENLLNSFTSKIIDSFVDGFIDSLVEDIDFGKIFQDMGKSGSGSGDWLNNAFSFIGGLFKGKSQGGIVPSTPYSQAGKDSVPAMLMPGEVVLSKNHLRNMRNNSSQQQQVFNINVSGDVSRQTRKEIVQMMPQIASGVNMQNMENNYKR